MSRPAHRRLLSLLFALVVPLGLLAAPAPANAAAFVITTNKTTVDINLGQTFTISGDVSPSWLKQTVYLQIFQDNAWQNLAQTSTTTQAGAYSITYKPAAMGVKKYRMYRPAAGGVSAGASKTITAKIHVWRDMYHWTPVKNNGMEIASSITMGGTTYPRSLRADWFDYIIYNLKGQCSHVRATYGVIQDTDADAQGKAIGDWLLIRDADDKVLHQRAFSAGQKEPSTTGTAGAYFVRFTWDYHLEAYDIAGVGTPQARCTF